MTDIIDADHRELDRLGHHPDEDHIPVPLDHDGAVDRVAEDALEGLVLKERHTGTLLVCDEPVAVRQ